MSKKFIQAVQRITPALWREVVEAGEVRVHLTMKYPAPEWEAPAGARGVTREQAQARYDAAHLAYNAAVDAAATALVEAMQRGGRGFNFRNARPWWKFSIGRETVYFCGPEHPLSGGLQAALAAQRVDGGVWDATSPPW